MKFKYNSLIIAFACALTASLLMLSYIPIGERFPQQDLMFSDLWVLNKLTFLKEAISYGLGSTIDFTQGFGVDITSDIKSQSSLLDIGNVFLLFSGPVIAAKLRFFLLMLYGFLGVYLYARSTAKQLSHETSIFFAILYISHPLFLGDCSHLTTVVHLTTPLLIFALNAWLDKFDRSSYLLLILTLTVTGGVADLNIFLIIPCLSLWHAATEFNLFQSNPKRFIAAYIICVVFFVAVFSNVLTDKLFHSTAIVSNNLLFSSIRDYTVTIFIPVALSFLRPSIPGPVTLFLYPAFFLFFLVFKKGTSERKEFIVFLCFVAFGFLLGYAPYVSDDVKAHVPSYVRYHLGAFPLLLMLSVISYMGKAKTLSNKDLTLTVKDSLIILSIVSAILLFNIVLTFFIKGPTQLGWFLLTLWLCIPFAVFALSSGNMIKRWGLCLVFSIAVPFMSHYLFNEVFPPYAKIIVDKEYSHYYLNILPEFIRRHTGGGSFVPIVNSPFGPTSGRNDGLLSLLELPDRYEGRTFLQWRHSYPKTTSDIYSKYGATGHGWGLPVNFFPFGLGQLDRLDDFANLSGSDYIISLGIDLPPSKYTFIASSSYEGNSALRSLEQDALYRLQFFNRVNLYKINRNGTERPYRLKYSKTHADLTLDRPVDELEVPIVYFDTLQAKTRSGEPLALSKSYNGFTKIRTSGIGTQVVTIYSFDPLRFLPVVALVLFLGLAYAFRVNNELDRATRKS